MRLQKLIFLFAFIFSLSVFSVFTPSAYAETHVSGEIGGDVTWNLAGSPYVVDSSIYISASSSLTIESGVIVKFAPFVDIGMYDGGSIKALGTPTEKIYFTSLADDTVGGDTNGDGSATVPDISDSSSNIWYGISIDGSSSSASAHLSLQNVVMRYAYTGILICGIQDVVIDDSSFEENRVGIEDCGNSHVDISNTKIVNNKIGISLNQADYLPNSIYTVTGLSIYNNTDYGVSNEVHGPYPAKNKQGLFSWFANLFKPQDVLAEEGPVYDYTVDFRNTWWGDASGPLNVEVNADGLGNTVSGLVLFDPWLPSDPTQESCTVDCFSSVLFLPGLKASRLYTLRASGSEDQLWEPNINSDVEYLYLNSDATSINQNIYTRDIIKETNVPISGSTGQNIYKSFSNMMDDLVSEQKITEWKSYAYDWRQSIEDVVNNGTKYENETVSLIDTLQSLVDSSKSGKVTIVTHSNGGLLAKALLKKLQDDKNTGTSDLIDKVDVLILVAVPEIGTAVAVPAILHGYDQSILGGWLLDETRARELGRNMLSAFGLLPSREYINRVSASPTTFVDNTIPSNITTKMVQTFGSAINSYAEYKSFLFGGEGRTDPIIGETNSPINLSETLFSQSESLHDNIDAFTPPESLRVIEVAGWGLDTLASFEYYPKSTSCPPGAATCPPFKLDQRPRFTSDGDGTVVVPSAQYMSFLGSAEKYWVDLDKHNEQLPLGLRRNREHKDILEVDSLNNFVQAVIEEKNITFDAVLKNSEPTDTSNRLRLSIHSPVTLDAYDIEGNHTGKVCPPDSEFCYVEENILNSSYLEFGEGKYINLPEDQVSKIKLKGIGTGTFTYESEKVLPDGTSSVSSFSDIPVTTQTQAEMVVNQNTEILELKLDANGDGSVDEIILPDGINTELSLNELIALIKQKISTLTIKDKIKQNLLKQITNLEKKIENKKQKNAKILANINKKISKQEMKGKINTADATAITSLLDLLEAQAEDIALDPTVLSNLKTKIQSLTIKANIKNDLLKRVDNLEKKQAIVKTLSNLSKNVIKKSTKDKIVDEDAQALIDILNKIEAVI